MSSADGIPRTVLDKPLHLLTEDDISQLTREDCRRYLKEKGMRRPSWNKSQAIQQVISLKALLEPTPESETVQGVSPIKKPRLPAQDTANRVVVPSVAAGKRAPAEFQISVSVEESAAPVSLKLSPRKGYARDQADQTALAADLAAGSPRVSRDTSLQVKQLTIFYRGKVNVYDEVSRDKARTLLQMAASPLNCLPDTPSDGTPVPQAHMSLPQSYTTKASPNYLTANLQPSQTVKALDNCQFHQEESGINREDKQVEGASSRKACVQRYLEKRKDRSRFKRKVEMPSSLDAYLNQRMVDNVHDEQPGPSDIYSSSPQSSLPHLPAKCSSAGNTIGDLNLSATITDSDEL